MILTVVALAALLAPTYIDAVVHEIVEADVLVSIPDGWRWRGRNPRYSARPKDFKVSISFRVQKLKSLERLGRIYERMLLALETPNGKLLRAFATGKVGDDWNAHAKAVEATYLGITPSGDSGIQPLIPPL